jgi:hypothetical protein
LPTSIHLPSSSEYLQCGAYIKRGKFGPGGLQMLVNRFDFSSVHMTELANPWPEAYEEKADSERIHQTARKFPAHALKERTDVSLTTDGCALQWPHRYAERDGDVLSQSETSCST